MKNKLVAGLLAMLGFSSCISDNKDDGDGGGLVLMYGPMWRSYFVVGGTVTDSDNNTLKNIKIVIETPDVSGEYPDDVVRSGSDGKYATTSQEQRGNHYIVHAIDDDGPANGGDFETQTKVVSTSDESLIIQGGTMYFKADFELVEKTPEEEQDK